MQNIFRSVFSYWHVTAGMNVLSSPQFSSSFILIAPHVSSVNSIAYQPCYRTRFRLNGRTVQLETTGAFLVLITLIHFS